MFRLLKNLEIELFAEGNDECVDRHLLTKDIVIKHRILDGLRGQDRISKAQAFDILVESLHDIRFMDGDNKRIIANFGSGVGRVSKDHYRGTLDKDKRRSHFDEESLVDYDETASLMEQQQVSPAYSEDVMLDASTPLKSHKPMLLNSSFASLSEPIFQIRQSIHELEKFHLKLDSQYAFLETEISQLKVKNNVDLHDLKVLMNNNNSMLERIDSIRENLVEVSGEFDDYKNKRGYGDLYFERLKDEINGTNIFNDLDVLRERMECHDGPLKHRHKSKRKTIGLPVSQDTSREAET